MSASEGGLPSAVAPAVSGAVVLVGGVAMAVLGEGFSVVSALALVVGYLLIDRPWRMPARPVDARPADTRSPTRVAAGAAARAVLVLALVGALVVLVEGELLGGNWRETLGLAAAIMVAVGTEQIVRAAFIRQMASRGAAGITAGGRT